MQSVRPSPIYMAEAWAVKKWKENKFDVAKIKMLRWIRKTMEVQELRLNWYRHVKQSDEKYVGNRVMVVDVQGRKRKRRPKRTWMNSMRWEKINRHEHRLHMKVRKDTYVEEE